MLLFAQQPVPSANRCQRPATDGRRPFGPCRGERSHLITSRQGRHAHNRSASPGCVRQRKETGPRETKQDASESVLDAASESTPELGEPAYPLLKVTKKHGRPQESRWWVQLELTIERLKSAPDYIQESRLSPEAKEALWDLEALEEFKREISAW